MTSFVQDTISHEVKETGCYCIIADETKDISKREQLSVVLRYFSNSTMYEWFIGYTNALEIDATTLHKYYYDYIISA